MINVVERWKVVFTHLDGRGRPVSTGYYLTRSFHLADLVVSYGFIELYADSLGLGSSCKHLCPASKKEEGRNLPQTPKQG